MKTLINWRITLEMIAVLFFASCTSDDDNFFQIDQLAGTWEQVWDGLMDRGTTRYTFFPESSSTGRIELYVTGWPDIDETTYLNYVIGNTGRLNIFTGRKYDGESKMYGEYDIHKLTASEMMWYKTDSNEEVARFKKVKLHDLRR